jgi:hypothetical protein
MKVIKGNFAKYNKEKAKKDAKMGPQPSENEKQIADCLITLANPFITKSTTIKAKKAIYYLSYTSWNLSIIKLGSALIYEQFFGNLTESEKFTEKDIAIINKMIEDKQARYPTNYELIDDIEFYKKDNQLAIYAKADFELPIFDDVIPIDANQDENEEDEDDEFYFNIDQKEFEEGYINRNLIVLRYKQPFVDLFNEVHDTSNPRYQRLESTAYLVDTMFTPQQRLDWLENNFDKLFKHELKGQDIPLVDWPKKRTYKLFKEYFDAEFKSVVYDFLTQPVSKF